MMTVEITLVPVLRRRSLVGHVARRRRQLKEHVVGGILSAMGAEPFCL
jgi:hypothetical protein